MAKTITAYKDCLKCANFAPIDKYNMQCKARDKKYLYGQSVPCDDKMIKKSKGKNDEVQNSEPTDK